MDINNIKERLSNFDNNKLMDVVKNYKQYGYNDEIRDYAIEMLEKNGISKNDLVLTGNFKNKDYDYANSLYYSFLKHSKIAFIFYIISFLIKISSKLFTIKLELINNIIIVMFFCALIVYLIFLVRSFIIQSDFYKITSDEYGASGAMLYLFLGMPFYLVMYFIFKNQMKEQLPQIR